MASLLAVSASFSYADTGSIYAKAEQFYTNQDFNNAFKEFERIAKTGDAQAMFNLGQMTRFGQGTKQDSKKALKLFKQAADKNYARAEMVLFEIYTDGDLGVKVDSVQARKHLEKASKLGWTDATVELANQYFAQGTAESEKKGVALLQPLAEQNNQSAQHLLAVYRIVNGVKTVNESSIMTGIKSLETLTKQGYIPSMMAVANMSATGEVLPQNLTLAKNLYTILAENNVPTAKERLAQVEQALTETPVATPKKTNSK